MTKPSKDQKLFVVKKFIWATSAKQAILKDKQAPVDDVWVDEKWKEGQQNLPDAIGYNR